MAWVSVSATKVPPYGPKWPEASGWGYSNMVISDCCALQRALEAATKRASGHGVGDAGIGLAYRLAEPADQGGILEPKALLHAGTHVNGPGPDVHHSIDHVCRIQPTRQNDWKGDAWGNLRPIESLSTAAIALDERIEQQAGRAGETRSAV